MKVLILEDMPMDAELMEYELERARIAFTSRRVHTREELVRALDEFRPDVILSDYPLPRFDGMTALAVARELAPAIPLLIVTGSVNEETAVGCMTAGADDYLLKGNLSRIGPAIEAAIARQRSRAEQARAQAALRRSEANLRAIFNNSLQCFVLVDRDGAIQAFNRTADGWTLRLRGRHLEEGERITEFLPGTAESLAAALAGETRCLEHAVEDLDGDLRWFETSDVPILDDGAVLGVCLMAVNIDERKRNEQTLRESEERYRDLFDNASDLVCMTDAGGAFLYVNRAWHDATGYSDHELGRMLLPELVQPEDRGRLAEALGRVLAGETVGHLDLTFVTSAGAPVAVEGSLSRIVKDGRPTMVRGIWRDVTERKRVEEQLRRAERMQAAGQLAGGVAHEVNNMMTGVIGFGSFLLRSLAAGDPRRADVEEIIRAGSRAAALTGQLLAFTRQQFRRPEVLDPNAVITGMERMLRRSLGLEHELLVRLGDQGVRVRVDRGQLEQVLVNLVLNARDAMQGHGRVCIETDVVTLDGDYAGRHHDIPVPSGSYLLVAVSDTGCGMPPEVQARVFEPFFTTKPVGRGTGLGLSTVYGIVKQSDGFIWAYSEPGHGTTFKIYLPAAELAEAAARAEPPAGAVRGGVETIMVVEAEDMVRSLASRCLLEHGYRVVQAGGAMEALAYMERHRGEVDLLITDVVMPAMGGRELAERVAAIGGAVPVLYMSGYTGDDVIRRGLLAPGAPFEQKPFSPEGLARRVRELLDRRAQADTTAVPA
ncbi:MAG TPA: PAS domain S-box protein [Gemmatimonadales bacterium]|nr:PAS domain S-box protein [Gemmatimonadales bacterium]